MGIQSPSSVPVLIAVVAMAALATPVHAIEFGYSTGTDNHLYQINLATGAATDLGAVSLSQAEGLAFHAAGTLLGIGAVPPAPQELWNLTSPPGALIGSTTIGSDFNDAGLASTAGRLYTVQGDGLFVATTLHELSPLTGAILTTTPALDPFGGDVYVDSLAINAAGRAFAADAVFTDSLYEIDLTTGVLTAIGALNIGGQFQTGLDFDSTGALYMLLSNGGLYTVNTTTGNASLIANVLDGATPLTFHGGFAIGNLEAVTAAVPEPAMVVFALIGGMSLMVRRKR